MSFKVGDRIECNWKHHGANFRGTVSAVNGDLHDIKFDDGDFEGQAGYLVLLNSEGIIVDSKVIEIGR